MHHFSLKMSLDLQICYIKMKMSLSLAAGANISTWKLTEHLKSWVKILL